MTVIQGARARAGLQAACIAAICAAAIGAAQQPAPPVFTAEQAAAGRAAYSRELRQLPRRRPRRAERGPSARGRRLHEHLGHKDKRNLLELIQATMPPGSPPLAPDRYLAIVTYILDRMAPLPVPSRSRPRRRSRSGRLRRASGRRPWRRRVAALPGAAGARGRNPAAAAAAAGRGAAPQTARGLTVRGFLLIKHRQDLAQRILVVRVQMKVVAAVRYEWL